MKNTEPIPSPEDESQDPDDAPQPEQDPEEEPTPEPEQAEATPAEDESQEAPRALVLALIVRRAAPIAPGHLFAEYLSLDVPHDAVRDVIDEHFVADAWHVVDFMESTE